MIETEIPEVKLINSKIHEDNRGFFTEVYRDDWIEGHRLIQVNHSYSRGGALRGLHYQLKRPQGKLVRVIRGKIFDVAVDLRKSSKNFGEWIGRTLSDANGQALWIPPGFAHGFLVLSKEADVVYHCTNYYHPEDEHTLFWNDASVRINWPLEGIIPLVSKKDANAPSLSNLNLFH